MSSNYNSSIPTGAEKPGGVLAMAQAHQIGQGPPAGMRQSSCFCGSVKLFFSSDVIRSVMCHCKHSRKISGTLTGSSYLLVPSDNVSTQISRLASSPSSSIQITQSPSLVGGTTSPESPVAGLKTYMKTVDSGNIMTNYFCVECGSTLYRKSSGKPGVVFIRSGCVDDEDGERRPDIEIFTDSKVEWVREVEGSEQFGKAA